MNQYDKGAKFKNVAGIVLMIVLLIFSLEVSGSGAIHIDAGLVKGVLFTVVGLLAVGTIWNIIKNSKNKK